MLKKAFIISLMLLVTELPAMALPKVWRSRGNDMYLLTSQFNTSSYVTYKGEKTIAIKMRKVTRCGTINIRMPKDKTLVPASLMSLPVQELPRCLVNKMEFQTPLDPEKVGVYNYIDIDKESRTVQAFRTPDDKVILIGFAPSTYQPTYLFYRKRKKQTDSCGILKILYDSTNRVSPQEVGNVSIDLGYEKLDFVFGDLPERGPAKCFNGTIKRWIYPEMTTDGTYGYFLESELPATLKPEYY